MKPIPGAKDRRPAVEVVLTVLHAGGKFGGGGYAISGACTAWACRWSTPSPQRLDVEVQRDGFIWTHGATSAASADAAAHEGQGRPRRPAPVTFWPDPEIFVETLEFK